MRNAPRVPLENRISYRCLSVASRITRHLAPWWKSEFGLTVTSWRVMAVIGRYEPLSAMEVAERTSTDAFFVGRAIDKLVEQGYLKKGVDPEDRRRLRLSLTATGRKVHRQVEDMINLVEADLLAGIPADHLSTFFATISLLESRAGRLGACDP